jgi:EAL domain-containing protein (putative c-di-GMP-specific phosphodiesterase class I)
VAFEIVDGVKFITSECALSTIKALQSKGFKIIINDFGSKLCDISLFMAIRPDYIKLHTDLTQRLEGDPHFLFIIQKLVDIIHFIGAKAIIKHLSNARLVQLCTSSGVDCLQGYSIGLPFEVTREE